jgi:hypothetical protein
MAMTALKIIIWIVAIWATVAFFLNMLVVVLELSYPGPLRNNEKIHLFPPFLAVLCFYVLTQLP